MEGIIYKNVPVVGAASLSCDSKKRFTSASVSDFQTMEAPAPQTFGIPWPELNDGLLYTDDVSLSDSGGFMP